ncbi:hypothetical protein BU17DRAFT_63783 [Hysterangium stoloniferum]|nr:hypothetical protein BU17DRAFT_63783 [Hysterangium stoloniferum]
MITDWVSPTYMLSKPLERFMIKAEGSPSPIAAASRPRTAPRTRSTNSAGPPARSSLLNPLRFLSYGQPTSIPDGGTQQLMQSAALIKVGVFGFAGYANRDSVPFAELYDIPEAEVLRGTLRWGGVCVFVGVLVGMGWLDQEPKGWLKEGMMWAEVGAKIVGAKDASESAILAAIASLLPDGKNTRNQVVSGLRWMPRRLPLGWAPLLDTLCARLEELMRYNVPISLLEYLKQKYNRVSLLGT